MVPYQVAIAGCGRIAAAHADALRRIPELARVTLAVDRDPARARAMAEQFGCRWSTRLEDILTAGVDAVHLCLPHDLHPVMAVRAMKAGIHVLTEKPVAITLQQADEMIRVQQETGRQLEVVFQTRFIQGVQTLRRMVAGGAFGRILSARSTLTWDRPYSYYESSDWKGTWEHEGGGVLIDQAIHSIDRVRYILGDEVVWIEGSVHNRCHRAPKSDGSLLRVEDTAEAAIGFAGGCVYSLYACDYYRTDAPIQIELVGEKGRCGLIQDMGFYELDGSYTEIRRTAEGASVGPSYWGTSHHVQIRNFYRALQAGAPPAVTAADARKTLEIVKGIYLASMEDRRITLPFTDVAYCDLGVPAQGRL